MRNLTIKRTKSFVASLIKMKIYIEDHTSNELTINNTPCRKIGELKNGEEKTFEISENEAKVYVIADTLSKNYCNEYYQLPNSSEDIFLSGKNMYNPTNGNAFRFDNNDSIKVAAHRKRGARKGLLILILAITVGIVAGFLSTSDIFSGKNPKEKTFSSDGISITLTDDMFSDENLKEKTFTCDGMSITLTNEFIKTDIENYTAAYGSNDVAIFVLKDPFDMLQGLEINTLEEYGNLIISNNGLSSAELKTVDGLTYFDYEFTNPSTNNLYRYYSYIYKSKDAFWLIQFAVLNETADKYTPQITKWAKSVDFTN